MLSVVATGEMYGGKICRMWCITEIDGGIGERIYRVHCVLESDVEIRENNSHEMW